MSIPYATSKVEAEEEKAKASRLAEQITIITFNTQNEALIDKQFKTPIFLKKIKLFGNMFTGDKTHIYINEQRKKTFHGFFEIEVNREVRYLKIQPEYGGARVGYIKLEYCGTFFNGYSIGTSAQLRIPTETAT